uniref:OSJNBa0032N05.19 protein n=1 Tax=Oryza sativa subsp. japonica TaxID=39947 RepID=Q5CAH9_ORYSJ|nr:OSJNBa0032N05.19 [Oryza sativa Japonica Group]
MQRCLHDQLGRNVEAYIDDVVIKTRAHEDFITDLEETFNNLCAFKFKLKLEKCTFGVSSGKLLGFMISRHGIDANPGKIAAIHSISIRLQRLQAFPHQPTSAHGAAPPRADSPLYRSDHTCGKHGAGQKIQRPVYFISEVLTDSKTRYTQIQKMLYAIFITACKLSHYLQAHLISIVTTLPLKDITFNKEATGGIAKWALELIAIDTSFQPRVAIKSQVLADLIAKWTEEQQPGDKPDSAHWQLFFDGSFMASGASSGAVLTSPKREKLRYVLQLHFPASNNDAEYEALLHGLRIAIALGIRRPNDNAEADTLSRIGSRWEPVPPSVFLERLGKPSIDKGKTTTPQAYCQGFFWQTVVTDAKKVVYTCKGCQFFAHNTNVPANELQTIPISWSFAVWGLDMVGPFKKAPGGITHLFVCIDKFSKCIEAKQVVKITAANAKEFMKG